MDFLTISIVKKKRKRKRKQSPLSMDFGILSHSVPPRATMHHSSSSTSSLSRTISYFHRRTSSPPASSISRFLRLRPPTLPSSSVLRIPTVRHCHDYRNDTSSETDLPILESDGGGRQSVNHEFEVAKESDLRSIWKQIKQILLFAGPATGLWICGPLMSLIDTVVIGQSSTLELAALGPGTVVCDYLGYLFMFLSISTSNMVATALARKDKDLAQHQISMLLFIALSCGVGMFIFTKLLGMPILSGFIGLKNEHMIPAANTYVQIRSFAWPAILVGMVAQSASLGMKDSWGPLKALAVASAVNCLGDIILCSVFGFGISGAAWATAVSQIVAAFMMIQTLKQTGFVAYSLHVPSGAELLQIIKLAAPVFLITTSKIVFYTILTYFATAMGTITVAAHQVMVNLFLMCALWGEPLSQSAQSFMPEMIYGVNHSLKKARMLLKSLLLIGALTGLISGAIGTSVAWLRPSIFTTDSMIIKEMHKVLIPSFVALMVTPSTLCFEGTLLAGRELGFLSLSMSGCLCLGGFLMFFCSRVGLAGCWWVFAGFQWTRFLLALLRLASPHGMLYSEEFYEDKLQMVRAT